MSRQALPHLHKVSAVQRWQGREFVDGAGGHSVQAGFVQVGLVQRGGQAEEAWKGRPHLQKVSGRQRRKAAQVWSVPHLRQRDSGGREVSL